MVLLLRGWLGYAGLVVLSRLVMRRGVGWMVRLSTRIAWPVVFGRLVTTFMRLCVRRDLLVRH